MHRARRGQRNRPAAEDDGQDRTQPPPPRCSCCSQCERWGQSAARPVIWTIASCPEPAHFSLQSPHVALPTPVFRWLVTSSTSLGSTWPQGACGRLSQATSLPLLRCGSTSPGERTELSTWPAGPSTICPDHLLPRTSSISDHQARSQLGTFARTLPPCIHVAPSPHAPRGPCSRVTFPARPSPTTSLRIPTSPVPQPSPSLLCVCPQHLPSDLL